MTQFSSLYDELLTRELRSSDASELFTTQRRQDAVLEGERQFADLTNCLVRQSSITCSNGVQEYDLLSTVNLPDGDFARMAPQGPEYRLVSSNSTVSGSTQHSAGTDFQRFDIERLNREEPGWRDSTGVAIPTGWYLRQDGGRLYFGFKEPPNILSSESGTLLVPYIAQPTQSTNSTSEPFTISSQVRTDLRPYHRALVHYAAHELEKLRGDEEMSDRQLQKFLGFVERFLGAQRPMGGQRVSLLRNYFRDARRTRVYNGDPRRDD